MMVAEWFLVVLVQSRSPYMLMKSTKGFWMGVHLYFLKCFLNGLFSVGFLKKINFAFTVRKAIKAIIISNIPHVSIGKRAPDEVPSFHKLS